MLFYSVAHPLNTNTLLHATGKVAFLSQPDFDNCGQKTDNAVIPMSMHRHHGIIDRFSYGTDIRSRRRRGLLGQRS